MFNRKQSFNKIKIGIVIIGRNEGERLKRCLTSVIHPSCYIVYVDSGSTDGSIEFARSLKIDVIELDKESPFTMARGRNAGFMRLIEVIPKIDLVQFIDGDCEMVDGYLEAAYLAMFKDPDITIVTGRRLERQPDASIYNRLCDIEWGKAIGEIQYCGGDLMVRSRIFKSIGMFNEKMIAGEEPELCRRIRKAGGKIVRIDHDMTLHDAAIHHFRQWWLRAVRCGHAYAENCAMHFRLQEGHNLHEVQSIIFWGAVIPITALICAVSKIWWPWAMYGSAIILAGYIALTIKVTINLTKKGIDKYDARLYAVSCVVAKFPGMIGIIKYWLNRLRGKQSKLIEYKQDSISKYT